MNTTNTAKATFNSLLNMVTKTLNTAGNAVEMLDASVEKMKISQAKQNITDLYFEESQYDQAAAEADAKFLLQIQEFRAKSTVHAQAYDASYAGLMAHKAGLSRP